MPARSRHACGALRRIARAAPWVLAVAIGRFGPPGTHQGPEPAVVPCTTAAAAEPTIRPDGSAPSRGEAWQAESFVRETERLRRECLAEVRTAADWEAFRGRSRRELLSMLGLDPLPERTDLAATVTSRHEAEGITVEQIHFQSRPGLYVTANLYLPQDRQGRHPAILYPCGHGAVKKDGVSYGNKVHYQHHGAWFARHGYVCLVIDSLQLGEIEAIHHGTHRFGMWWWLGRGYTPAGVEAWNCIRALDYLQSRPEVDRDALGVTGRSGGGAYSWWVAALDDRIRAAVPVAGITDLENHVVDGCIEGHCDCMFQVNTFRWDYPQLAALVSPRPLLIGNTDRDPIFPLDGVVRTYEGARRIYALQGEADKIGLNITAGGHVDAQELQLSAIRWMDGHLRRTPRVIEEAARPLFAPEQLKVFRNLPADQINTKVHDTFVRVAHPVAPPDAFAWEATRDAWRRELLERTFRGWPASPAPLALEEAFHEERAGMVLRGYDFTTQEPFRLRLYLLHAAPPAVPSRTVLHGIDADGWRDFLAACGAAFGPRLAADLKDARAPEATPPEPDVRAWERLRSLCLDHSCVLAYAAPRGVGLSAWPADAKRQTHLRRRYALLGQTLEGMQVWDLRRAIEAVRTATVSDGRTLGDTPLWLHGHGSTAALVMYASLFDRPVHRLDLESLPRSHDDGPALLNVRRIFDMPQALAMAADRSEIVLYQDGQDGWDFARHVVDRVLRQPGRLEIRGTAGENRR